MKMLYRIFVLLLTTLTLLPAQNLLWHMEGNGPGGEMVGVADAVIDSDLNVYVTNSTSQTAGDDGYDITTIKYDSDGDTLWCNTLDVYGYKDATATICLDESGNVYTAGYGRTAPL